MIQLSFPPLLIAIANHLWQSTLFALAVALAAFLLRNHRAALRHKLWLCASLKFLVPFAGLVSIGGGLPKPIHRTIAPPRQAAAAARPFNAVPVFELPRATATIPPVSRMTPLAGAIFTVWLAGFLALALCRAAQWRVLRGCIGRARPAAGVAGVPRAVPSGSRLKLSKPRCLAFCGPAFCCRMPKPPMP